jgi:hypothetical protein
MRSTTEYKGWTIEIHSIRRKSFSKGAMFSACASVSRNTDLAGLDCVGAGLPGDAPLEKVGATSSDGHCTVDQAEAEALTRAKIAIDKWAAASPANPTPLGARV